MTVPRHLVLNGPTGTRLIERGLKTHPILWTAEAALSAPELLRSVHAEYIAAGANIITSNTFGASPYRAKKAGMALVDARRLVHASTAIAMEAIEDAEREAFRLLAGSVGPLEDCYKPLLTPSDSELERWHGLMAEWLAESSAELVMVQTMSTTREALAALSASKNVGFDVVYVSFITDATGERLLGGELLTEAAGRCLDLGAQGVLVNCVHQTVIDKALATLGPAVSGRGSCGAYGNKSMMRLDVTGEPEWLDDGLSEKERVDSYLRHACEWVARYDVQIVGSCCGTSPEFTRALAGALGNG